MLQQEIRTRPRTGVLDVKLFIDGKYVDAISGKTFDDVNPATGELIARVAEADYADVDLAVKAARKAFDEGPWPRMPVAERSAILMKLAAGIKARIPEWSELESLDTGKPIRESSHLDIPRAAYNFEFFAELIKYEGTDCNPVDDKFLNYSLREPVGVAGCISPWNLPLLLLTWKLGPALACGNTVVCKPAEFTPITASLLGEVANEAGLPPGVLNIVQGFGPNAAGSAITEHPGVDCISFTGETTTGKAIMKAAADGLKEVSFELGGKAAAVIFADADLDVVIAQTTRSTFLNQGEVCLASPRLLVQRPIYEEFCKRYQAAAESLVFGDPLDHDTSIGSLVDKEHYDRVAELHRDRQSGRRALALRRRTPGPAGTVRQGRVPQADGVRRREQQHAHLPGRSVRAGRDHHALRHRRRGHRDRERRQVRAGRHDLHAGPQTRPPRCAQDPRGYRVGELLVRPRSAHAVRRDARIRASAAKAAASRSTSTANSRTSVSRSNGSLGEPSC